MPMSMLESAKTQTASVPVYRMRKQKQTHKTERLIYPRTSEPAKHARREALFSPDEEEEEEEQVPDEADNPYGFIRYFDGNGDNNSDDEITFFVPAKTPPRSNPFEDSSQDEEDEEIYEPIEIPVSDSEMPCSTISDQSIQISTMDNSSITTTTTYEPLYASVCKTATTSATSSDISVIEFRDIKKAKGCKKKKLPCIYQRDLSSTVSLEINDIDSNLILDEAEAGSDLGSLGQPQLRRRRSLPVIPFKKEDSFDYIDKTPSEISLLLPYCPPIQVDFEDFSRMTMIKQQRRRSRSLSYLGNGRRRMSRSRSPERDLYSLSNKNSILVTENALKDYTPDDLMIVPIQEADNETDYDSGEEIYLHMPIASPAFPLQQQQQFVSSQEVFIEEEPERRRSNQKNKYVVEVVARITPPLRQFTLDDVSIIPEENEENGLQTPDLLKNLNDNSNSSSKKSAKKPTMLKSVKCQPSLCYSRTLSSEEEENQFRPLNSDVTGSSIDEELPFESLGKDAIEDEGDGVDENFSNGFYAHCWMKAQLQQQQIQRDINNLYPEDLGTLI